MLLATYAKVIREHLRLEGFKLSPGNRGTVYSKEDEEWKYFISFDNIFRADYVTATCSGADLAHKQTEAVFKKLSDKYPDLPRVTSTFTDYKQYERIDTRKTIVNNEEELIQVIELWKETIDTHILPFFRCWTDLRKIDTEIINKVSWQEMHRYIPGVPVHKALIIMKLTDDTHYERFMKERQDAIRQALEEGKTQYKMDLEILEDLSLLLN